MADPAAIAALFPEPLVLDPSVALNSRSITLPKTVAGPVHGAQFVVEIAGPRSVPAQQARELLGPRWYPALGEPEVFVMAPADNAWRLLSTTDRAGSYDSIALGWNLIDDQGSLSTASARHLLQSAETYGSQVGRRAFPFPAPDEVDRLVRALAQAKENLDVGVEILLQGPAPILERDIWSGCAALGLDLSTEGAFIWRVPNWEDALLAVAPIEEGQVFSLRNVQSGMTHECLSIGFNIPRSPDPANCLEAVYQVGRVLSNRLGIQVFDDDGRALALRVQDELRSNLKSAVESLRGSGLTPGSPITRKLFS